jgi:hypothetical protein
MIVRGDKRTHFGTWDGTGVATGDVDTQLKTVENFYVFHTGSSSEAKMGVFNETLPCAGSAVTILFESDDAGIWIAEGW